MTCGKLSFHIPLGIHVKYNVCDNFHEILRHKSLARKFTLQAIIREFEVAYIVLARLTRDPCSTICEWSDGVGCL